MRYLISADAIRLDVVNVEIDEQKTTFPPYREMRASKQDEHTPAYVSWCALGPLVPHHNNVIPPK